MLNSTRSRNEFKAASLFIDTAEELKAFAGGFVLKLGVGDTVLLYGDLGVGKTTFVRGALQGLGWAKAVRSPTFNLIQIFDTKPPVMHCDLYRLGGAEGLGLEEYFSSHLCFVEWPDRLGGLIVASQCYRVALEFHDAGRRLSVFEPGEPSLTP